MDNDDDTDAVAAAGGCFDFVLDFDDDFCLSLAFVAAVVAAAVGAWVCCASYVCSVSKRIRYSR